MPSNDERLAPITIENAKVIFKNFRGAPDKFDKQGHKNFHLLLDENLAEELRGNGFNVKPLRKRDEDEDQMYHMEVKINMNSRRPPRVVMIGTANGTKLNEVNLDDDTIGILDSSFILTADLTINPYQWEVRGATGTTAYLQTLYITVELDPLEAKYAGTDDIPDEPAPEEW